MLVFFTISAFFNIFIDNMIFKDNYPNILNSLAKGEWNIPTDTPNPPNDNSDGTDSKNGTLRF